MKLGEVLVVLMENIFNLFLVQLLRLGPSPRPFLISQPAAITQQTIMMSFKFFILLKVCAEAIKIV